MLKVIGINNSRSGPENYRFYKITQTAYLWGLGGHLLLGFFFLWLKVYEMVWFNFYLQRAGLSISLLVNRRGSMVWPFVWDLQRSSFIRSPPCIIVDAPARQGAKVQESAAADSYFSQGSRQACVGA